MTSKTLTAAPLMQGNRHAHTRVLRWAVLASLVSAREIVEEPHAVALSV